MKKTIIIMLTVCSAVSVAQNKIVKTFYDLRQTMPKEVYYTNYYGVKNGSYKLYSEYGGVISEGNYKEDIMIGTWKFKDEKGISTSIETYDNNGVKNGPWLKYCLYNFKLKWYEGNYKDGKKDGLWTNYICSDNTTESKIESKETYSMDILNGPCEYNLKDGQREIGIMLEGHKVKEWKYYRANGTVWKTETYSKTRDGQNTVEIKSFYLNGKLYFIKKEVLDFYGKTQYLVNEEINFDTTGVMTSKTIWKSDTVTNISQEEFYIGSCEEYYPDLKLKLKSGVRYNPNRDEETWFGKHTTYYPNGNKKYECEIDKSGNIVKGTYIPYFEDGRIDEKGRE